MPLPPLAEDLERRYDGPIPPADPLMLSRPPAAARSRLFDRLAAEGRAAVALRRARQLAAEAAHDPRMAQLGRSLAYYRHQGVVWRG